jgi:hypothetical protein
MAKTEVETKKAKRAKKAKGLKILLYFALFVFLFPFCIQIKGTG